MPKHKTAIFWMIGDTPFVFEVDVDEEESVDGIHVDCPYEHWSTWDSRLSLLYGVEYWIYPRGRLLYDMKKGRYLLYMDKAISKEGEKAIVDILGLKKGDYLRKSDEHYSTKNPF